MTASPILAEEDPVREERMTRSRKSRSIHVYLKPGMREDDLLLAVWDAMSEGGRPQDAYRRLLLEGVKRMVENGDMPLSIMKDPRVVRHLGVLGDLDQARRPVVLMAPHGGFVPVLPGQSGLAAPAPPPAVQPSGPASAPAPVAKKRAKGLDPNLM